MKKPSLNYDNGIADHDRYEREEYAYERAQEEKSEMEREENHEPDNSEQEADILHTNREQVADNCDYND